MIFYFLFFNFYIILFALVTKPRMQKFITAPRDTETSFSDLKKNFSTLHEVLPHYLQLNVPCNFFLGLLRFRRTILRLQKLHILL